MSLQCNIIMSHACRVAREEKASILKTRRRVTFSIFVPIILLLHRVYMYAACDFPCKQIALACAFEICCFPAAYTVYTLYSSLTCDYKCNARCICDGSVASLPKRPDGIHSFDTQHIIRLTTTVWCSLLYYLRICIYVYIFV